MRAMPTLVHFRPLTSTPSGPPSPICSAASSTSEARGAEALYILGDLFEAWVGDDDPSDVGAFVADRLAALRAPARRRISSAATAISCSATTTPARAHAHPPDPAVVVLEGAPALLMHGDTLCTDDVAYQAFRAQTRDPKWQAQFLAQPLPRASRSRSRRARRARRTSRAEARRPDGSDHRRRAGDGRRDDGALRHSRADPRPYASARRCTTKRTARASCSATGTNRDRCCGVDGDGAHLRRCDA
jgi:hypothetical protein